jgi:hypothetical protein
MPLSWPVVQAWMAATGTALSPEEQRAVMAIDAAMVSRGAETA